MPTAPPDPALAATRLSGPPAPDVALADTRISGPLAPDVALADTRLSGSELAPSVALAATRLSEPTPDLASADTHDGSDTAVRARTISAAASADSRTDARPRLARVPPSPADAGTIGRYRVLERLGVGGMGVVYAAYDERLDRRVAVKVLHPDGSGRTAGLRLVREARALARLSHPNIVGVHEVGVDGDRTFVAMEFVRGRSLDAWLAERRSWRDVVAVFLEAGRGLAAAHAAGVVHRDVKPANVLVGDDGRVKVLDFGLARLLDPATDGVDIDRPLDLRLTRAGAVMGTPLYMSPEQLAGAELTPASDQFSFFVSLYEALWGALPFGAASLRELRERLESGVPAEPPTGRDVPAWLRRVVWRGLEKDPTRRFPDMHAALTALAHDPGRRRLRVAAIAGLMLVSAGASAALRGPDGGRCEGALDRAAAAWSPAREAAAAVRFAAVTATGADAWARVEPRLGRWIAEWSRLRQDRCRRLADGELSIALHDRSVACLEGHIARFDALVTAFIVADVDAVERAPAAVAALPALAGCVDVAALSAEAPLPDDPDDRAAALAGSRELSAARGEIDLGRTDRALARTAALADAARARGDERLLAAAELVRGDALHWTRDGAAADAALSDAFTRALAASDDRTAVEALARRIFVRAELAGEPVRALADADLGRALLRRAGGDPRLEWLLENNLAVAEQRAGHHDAAALGYTRALATAEAIAPDAVEQVYTRYNLARLAMQEGRVDAAREQLSGGLAVGERLFGADHPALVPLWTGLADAEYETGHLVAAAADYRRARILAELRPTHDLATLLPIVEMQARIAGERREAAAEPLADHAEALARAAFGPEHPRRALAVLRPQWLRPGRDAAAAAALALLADHGVEWWTEALVDRAIGLQRAGHPDRAAALLTAARSASAWRDASPAAQLGVRMLETEVLLAANRVADAAAALPDAPRGAPPWISRRHEFLRGSIAAAHGDAADAVALLRRAVDGYASYDPDHPERLAARAALSGALRDVGQAREADAIDRDLAAAYRRLGPGFAAELADIERRLAGSLRTPPAP